MTQQVVGPLVKQGLSELAAGRPDRATATATLLRPLQTVSSMISELQQCLVRCHGVHESLAARQFAEAEAQLGVLGRMLPESTWIEEARSALSQIVQQLNVVAAGPLGMLDRLPAEPVIAHSATGAKQSDRVAQHRRGGDQPTRSILQVDGVGRLLLLTADVITVGAASSGSARVDVALLTEGPAATITIRRDGDDYFAESSAEFVVNGQPVTRRLLTSGDTIAAGTRGRLRFQKPVAASGSAVLQITGSRTNRRDIRNVVLMSDSLLFGPAGAHFRIGDLAHPLVLHCNRDGFALRETMSQGAGGRTSAALAIGEPVVVNDVRFALSEAN